VHARGDDDLEVVDAVVGEEVEHHREHALAHVGAAHRRQRERDVIEGDDHLHARAQLRVEGLAVVRVVDRVPDGRVGVFETGEGGLGVDHPRARGEVDFDEAIAREENARRALTVEGDDAGVAHGRSR
jgi:hypothetical protein